jgi:hypothetical protein
MASIHSRTIIVCTTELKRSPHSRPEDLAIEQLERAVSTRNAPVGVVQRIMVSKHPVGWTVTFRIKIETEEALSEAS